MGEELFTRLQESVTRVISVYGNHSGLAIEDDHCVATFCRHLEAILLHGALRRNVMIKVR